LFTAPELQVLISVSPVTGFASGVSLCSLTPSVFLFFMIGQGTPQAFDVDDLRKNTSFAGGFHPNHRMVRWLWEILESFDETQKSAFLFFSTSCSRAPLLGLGSLHPKFSVQQIGGPPNDLSLPTASTCLHLLRLP